MKLERSILLFIKGYENHSFLDKWANEGIKGRVRPGVQDFGGGEKVLTTIQIVPGIIFLHIDIQPRRPQESS